MNKNARDSRNVYGDSDEPGAGDVTRGGILRTFSSFKYPVYRIYYGAMVGQWFAMSMQIMTRSLLIYRLTGSSAAIGIVAITQAVPTIIVSLFGGAIADRLQKKHVLLAGQLASAAIALSIALSLSLGYLTAERWWVLIVTSTLQGAVMGFMMPSRMAIIPEIVPRSGLMNAISLSSMGQTTFRLMGPALAGFLIEAYDFSTIYYLMTGVYCIAIVFAFYLPCTSPATAPGGNALRDVTEGIRYLRHHTAIMLVVIFGAFHVICGHPFMQLMPVFTEDVLGVGASGLGILMTASGVGAMLSSLVMASLPNRKRGLLLLLGGLVMGVSLMVFSLAPGWAFSLVLMAPIGMGPTLTMIISSTLIQNYVEPNYRGRMQSFIMMGMGLASLGTFAGGLLAESVGIQWSIGGLALMLTLVSVGYLIFAKKVTRLE
ncbi:MFS transporter [Chloroflexota bacterium]